MTKEKKPFFLKRIYSPEFSFVRIAKRTFVLPVLILIVGAIVMGIWGLNLGIEFTGGRILVITGFDNYGEAKDTVTEILEDNGVSLTGARIQRENSNEHGLALSIRFQSNISDEEADILDTQIAALLPDGYRIISFENLHANVGRERLLNVFIAATATLIAILIYVLFRFKFTSGVAAVIGLFHDVLIMTALVAIFQIQVNFVFVAAVLTVVGYSLNNTLVLFDRIRNKEKDPSNTQTVAQKVDSSLKETLARTLNMTVTTLVPLFFLIVLGVPAIREFTLPILFGLLAGAYSTIFLTSTLYVRFENAATISRKRRENRARNSNQD
jgi:SecD/SecF fusion protein